MTNNDQEAAQLLQRTHKAVAKSSTQSALKSIIYILNYSIFWYCGIIWILIVVAVAGAYILSLLGACTLSDCNSFINFDNQMLTALFTAINLYAFPGRLARMWALFAHGSENGVDAFGDSVPNKDYPKGLLAESYDPSTFYSFSWIDKCALVFLFITSAISQFINQVKDKALFRSFFPSFFFF